MSSIVVVGSQWGDEGKGKIVDYLSNDADVIARYQGGDNAGHTIVFNNQKFQLQLIPSGIFYSDKIAVIGNGVVLNPKSLFNELKYLNDRGVNTDNLRISSRAHVIMPYHTLFDSLQEKMKEEKIGTTNKGIGPAYMDKVERIGIRIADLINPKTLEKKLKSNLKLKNNILKNLYGEPELDFDEIYNEYLEYGKRIEKYVDDTSIILEDKLDNNENILFEGAQGVMLDVDHGTYPYVTSSNPIAGGAAVGSGIGPTKINQIIGTCKAYTSRVGEGPFPTELNDEIGDKIRETGHEYGVVTKRPRRIGWFDSVAMRHAARVSGFTNLALNCLDVLDDLDTIKICRAYKLNGKEISHYPANLDVLDDCEPIYEELPGWKEDTTNIKKFDDLPQNAQNYLRKVEELTGVKLAAFSVGPDREQTNILKDLW
ncbi:adenylosuccinate synthase [Lactobacillus sp. S2-2]|uniref:adenylosuccinate synthase n=1 Tax=Lactobacillus sp. S2-2 TaxID=2692917 RepID=UPI001EFF659C|nr:adenylosuccinate synthase [Lactobacillus sp. S2-2]MCF6514668.1 adenylosuccinate synthase [Lactobacillus sp. S2-2]